MKLSYKGISNREAWESKGYELPKFNIEKMKTQTMENPVWIHFGVGNIFRSFPAMLQQKLLNMKKTSKGIIAVEGYDYELIDRINKPCDNLSILMTLKSDGNVDKTVVGSIAESLKADPYCKEDFKRIKDIFKKDSLQMATFTITEKGYSIYDKSNKILPAIAEDFERGPENPQSYMGKITSFCYERFLIGKKKIALVSLDNCSHNGLKLYTAINEFAKRWAEKGMVENSFLDYINDKNSVSFPCTMIDKITPRPDDKVKEILINDGIKGVEPIITEKHTYAASFTNSEECEYLVIEDVFPNGRPPLEEAGVKFTNREIVDKVEKMKVCTCLNPIHTTLAIFGCLLSYKKMSAAINDEDLRKLAERVGYDEGLKVVTDPKIINPRKFIDEVFNKRIPNPFMPDTPQRIATDTSQKMSVRFGETIKSYIKDKNLDIESLEYIPLVIAGWCRYLLGIDDNGEKFEISPDPMLDELRSYIKDVEFGKSGLFTKELIPILSNKNIFGVNLYDVGLGKKVESYFEELVAGKGFVRKTLKRYLR